MQNHLTAIIVDDEESAREILFNLLKVYCPEITVVSSYASLPEAANGISQHTPDVVFLDIEMPNYAGFEIISFFEEPEFEIIFVTAYDKYAVKAFEIAAMDYLLKPVDIDRLKQSVQRLKSKVSAKSTPQENYDLVSKTLKGDPVSKIAVIDQGYRHMIELGDVVAIEAMESYSKFHLATTTSRIASKNLKHFEEILDHHPDFFRTHKSWIINKRFLHSYSKSQLQINMSNGLTAKLSKYRKAEFESFIN